MVSRSAGPNSQHCYTPQCESEFRGFGVSGYRFPVVEFRISFESAFSSSLEVARNRFKSLEVVLSLSSFGVVSFAWVAFVVLLRKLCNPSTLPTKLCNSVTLQLCNFSENFPSSSYSSSSGSASKHGDGLDDVLGSLLSGDGGTSSRRSSSSSSRAEKPKETEWVCTYCGKTYRRRSSTTGGPWSLTCAHHPDGAHKGRHHFVQVR